jgi:plasmid stabilization system protein ParE
MRLPVVLSIEAEADLDQAAQWYEQRSARLGADLVTKVHDILVRIGDNPELYPKVHHDIRRALVRRFPYGVFYRVSVSGVEVVGIFHDRRDPSTWQDRA